MKPDPRRTPPRPLPFEPVQQRSTDEEALANCGTVLTFLLFGAGHPSDEVVALNPGAFRGAIEAGEPRNAHGLVIDHETGDWRTADAAGKGLTSFVMWLASVDRVAANAHLVRILMKLGL